MINQLSEIIQGLNKNQKIQITVGGIVLLIVLIYLLFWLPFSSHVGKLSETVNQKKILENWMLSASQEVAQLKKMNNGISTDNGRSLLSIVDDSAKRANLQNSVKRVEPDQDNKVKIRLEQVGFDEMIIWLEKLSSENNINVDTISVDSQQITGVVNTRVTLAGPTK